ncbi:MAG: hypothetical protein OEX81_01150 [Candidatus Pacebacteria bacterium]|nr:hypothetical protein [Candidatus Paceibacterota bacterium]
MSDPKQLLRDQKKKVEEEFHRVHDVTQDENLARAKARQVKEEMTKLKGVQTAKEETERNRDFY